MAIIALLGTVLLLLFNGCGTTQAASASVRTQSVLNNYSNINLNEGVSNSDLHIFTNDEEALVVPCYYWKMIRINEDEN